MKKLLAIFILFCSLSSFAQSNFAPVGAVWYNGKSGDNLMLKAEAIRKVTKAGKLCTEIQNSIFVDSFTNAYGPKYFAQPTLYLYSNADTVFVYNDYMSDFTPLYIFNVASGDTVRLPILPSDECAKYMKPDTKFEFVIDSVKMVDYDGSMLKTVYSTPLFRTRSFGFDPTDLAWCNGLTTFQNVYIDKLGTLNSGFLPNCTGWCAFSLGEGCTSPYKLRCYFDSSMSVKLVLDSCISSKYMPQGTNISEKLKTGNAIKIHPNPSSDWVEITYANKTSKVELKVLDLLGKTQYSQAFQQNEYIKFNCQNLPSGMYFVQIIDSEYKSIANARFVKQ